MRIFSHRIGIAVVMAALAAASGAGRAGDPPKQSAEPPTDEGLLEFLGSVDQSSDSAEPDDGSWLAYLSQTDIGKVAKASQAPQAPAPSKQQSSASGAGKAGGPGG